MNKKMIMKLGILVSLLVVNVFTVFPATPVSSCTIFARVLLLRATITGRVSTNGNQCIPLGIPDIAFSALRTGVRCGSFDDVVGAITVTVRCPN